MKNFIHVTIFTILLTSCSAVTTTEKPIVLPNGKQGYAIKCNGAAQSIGECMEKAGQLCPKGYHVLDKNAEGGTFGSYNFATGTGMMLPVMKRNIVVQCK